MKKSEIVLLWVAGLWGVVCLVSIAESGRWASGLALILAGWLACGLLWLSIRKWPKRSTDKTNAVTFWSKAKGCVRRALLPSVGYVLALIFLFAWLNSRTEIAKQRDNVAAVLSRITSGELDIFDCVVLPTPLDDKCMPHIKSRVVPPEDLPPQFQQTPTKDTKRDSWEDIAKDLK